MGMYICVLEELSRGIISPSHTQSEQESYPAQSPPASMVCTFIIFSVFYFFSLFV